jgi:hypothetical protein
VSYAYEVEPLLGSVIPVRFDAATPSEYGGSIRCRCQLCLKVALALCPWSYICIQNSAINKVKLCTGARDDVALRADADPPPQMGSIPNPRPSLAALSIALPLLFDLPFVHEQIGFGDPVAPTVGVQRR